MMKVLLVKPHNLSDHIQPSLGLGYLASSVRRNHEVEILDCIKERLTPELFKKRLSSIKPDVCGIQCYTYDLYSVKEMLRSCKENSAITVIGGPHPSAAPFDTMEFFGKDLDFLFQGEAEAGFGRFLDALSGRATDFGGIPGLVWRKAGKIEANPKRVIDDLERLGMPAWDLIHPESYPESQHGAFFRNFPVAPIMATRGCPFSCTFCAGSVVSGKKIRKRSVPGIIGEIRTLHDDFGIKEFYLVDDNFTMDRRFVMEFLNELDKTGLGMTWAVPNGVRVDTLDDEVLALMKKTGLYLVSLGIESGSDRILRLMKKSTDTRKIRDSVSLIRKHGIDVAGFFILGFPGETRKDIEKTIKFSLELDLIRANFFTYLPFPGTESYDSLKKEGKLKDVDLHRFYFMNATFTPEGMDRGALKALQRKAFLSFFLRPKIFFKNLKEIKSFRHFKFLLGRFARWMFLK